MRAQCEREAVELHDFLRDWLIGRLPRADEAFSRFKGVMGEDLLVISPRGTTTTRVPLLQEFESIHGQLAAKADAFEIWIENFELKRQLGDAVLFTYEEWHRLEGRTSARLSTVLYGARPDAPNGVEWLHVHETWLPGQEAEAGERFPAKENG